VPLSGDVHMPGGTSPRSWPGQPDSAAHGHAGRVSGQALLDQFDMTGGEKPLRDWYPGGSSQPGNSKAASPRDCRASLS
jgi:hypothetical protein